MMANGDVVVNFSSQVIFWVFLFLGMVMHDNEVETKEKGKLREIKISYKQRLTFALERSGYTWISWVKSFGLPAIFLRAQPGLLSKNTFTKCYLFTYTSFLL